MLKRRSTEFDSNWPTGPEKSFEFYLCMSAISLCSSHEKGDTLFFNKLESLSPTDALIEIGQLVLKKKLQLLKFHAQTDIQTDNRSQKSLLELSAQLK